MTNPPAQTRQIPPWVGVAIVVLILGALAWWVWSLVVGARYGGEGLVEVRPERQIGSVFDNPRARPDGVRMRDNENYTIKAGDCLVGVTKSRNDTAWRFRFSYTLTDLVTPDQQAALTARFRLPRDPAFAKSLKVTPEQIKQLQAIPEGYGMVVDDASRKRLEQLWNAYLAAPQPRVDAEQALINAVGDIGKAGIEPTRRLIAERVAMTRSVLTPEQIQAFKQ